MKEYSTSWKSSTSQRKQRKYRANAPLHTRHKFVSAPLSKQLRTSIGRHSVPLRSGDKVKVLRGDFAGKEGRVEQVSLEKERIYVAGVVRKKKDGSSSPYYLHPSNVQVIELNLDDKKRKSKLKKETNKQKPKLEEKK